MARDDGAIVEINFDGIIGPSHNYAGLSLGNLASARNAGDVSHPRAAALQGIDKMRANLRRGLVQGLFVPLPRPATRWLEALGTTIADADPAIAANAMSASAMWAANAATVSPAPDTADGKCHLTVANLRTMPHRSHEWRDTLAQLEIAFAHDGVRGPRTGADRVRRRRARPITCGSRAAHGAPGVEVFVYGVAGGAFPARQHVEASRAVARRHALDPARVLFAEQSEEAIAAGAFHNDVVAVANGPVLFAHERAFADKDALVADLAARVEGFDFVEVADAEVPLADAIRSYLFNAQLVTTPDGAMTLVAPTECRETPSVKGVDRPPPRLQRRHPPGRLRRCPPVDGQWRRARLPAAARGVRSRDGRSALPGRRGEARPAGERHRRALARSDRGARPHQPGADRANRRRARGPARGARPDRAVSRES